MDLMVCAINVTYFQTSPATLIQFSPRIPLRSYSVDLAWFGSLSVGPSDNDSNSSNYYYYYLYSYYYSSYLNHQQ